MQVPASDMEALKSPLMGMFEKRRAMNFFQCVCLLAWHVCLHTHTNVRDKIWSTGRSWRGA